MGVSIKDIGMRERNERLIPATIIVTFSNDEKGTYRLSSDDFIDETDQAILCNQALCDLSEEPSTFEALGAKIFEQLHTLNE